MASPLLGELALEALKTAIREAPELATWIGTLIAGAPDTPDNRRVADILPERSESAKVAEDLRRA